ncbi:MAG TPA: SUMF1/EgtB/PvdO family nonheme iron enzyme [Tepidisphaeraceae bacterium]|nr:SUMF1/EgtB/PvdO family nonheme iron enzyme [Tepidisphaeraceae bacterium]
MANVGKYEVLEAIHLAPSGSLSRARRADGGKGVYAVKRFSPPVDDPTEPRWEVQAFLDRARAQQHLVSGGARHWAAVHDLGVEGDGAWFVADYHPLSAQKLIDGCVDMKPEALRNIVSGIVQGLSELKALRNRAHGNLKPANVLFAGRDLASARVLLTDLASNGQATRVGEAGDLYTLGEVIYALTFYRRPARGTWPLPFTAQWEQLGRHGEAWRQLCSDLLNPTPAARPNLIAIARRLQTLRPPRKRRVRRALALLAVPVILLGGAVAVLSYLDHSARKQFCQSRHEWFGQFAQAISDPARRRAWGADKDLKRVLDEVPLDAIRRIDCNRANPVQYSLKDYQAVRDANVTVDLVQRDVTTRWPVVARAADLRRKFADRGWAQPAAYLAKRIDAARAAPGADVAGAIDRLLRASPHVESGLALTESDWKTFSERLQQIQATHDPVLSALAHLLRRSAESAVKLDDNGFQGLDEVHEDGQLADRLAEALRTTWPTNVDRERFDVEVKQAIDPAHVKKADVDRWLALVALNAFRPGEARAAAEALRKRLNETADLVTHAHVSPDEADAFNNDRRAAAGAITEFEATPVTQHTVDEGAFAQKRDELQNRIDALRKFYHPEGPEDWLKTLPAIATSSDRINAYWEAWRRVLRSSLGEMNKDRKAFLTYQQGTEQLRGVLVAVDQGFAPPPTLPDPAFSTAARKRRELAMEKLLPLIDPRDPKFDPDALKSAQEAYGEWSRNLISLSGDFPLTKDVLTLDDRPDEKWKQKAPGFWSDPAVQALVKADVERINRLQGLTSASRAELAKSAAGAKETEIALLAWRLLGGSALKLAWPAKSDELAAERQMRERLATLLKTARDSKEIQAATDELHEQGPVRWRRFVEGATSEAMIQQAWNLRPAFDIDAAQLAKLSAAARYDLWLGALRQGMSANEDDAVREAIASLGTLAADPGLKDRPEMKTLPDRLTKLEAKEPFADQSPGDIFRVALPGTQQQVEFKRVEPAAARAFYLCTTEVSAGQFAGVIEAQAAWPQARMLPWAYQPGKRDTRPGPRAWEWSEQSPVTMAVPALWLTPDEDNDYPPAFRAGRFNRNALSDRVGGNPSADHPMQYVSAQAALFYAGLCGCRLPASTEWQTAYEAFEKSAPLDHWNLRDRAWEMQRKYVAANHGNRWPDEGIFPVGGSTGAAGVSASSRAGDDGALYFRPVASAAGSVFHHLVGNVAEYVCDASAPFDAWPEKKTAEGVRKFAEQFPGSLSVIGGSALSAPQTPVDKPLPVEHAEESYADVGLRLAFTAPSRSLAEKARWALGDQPYLWPKEAGSPAK